STITGLDQGLSTVGNNLLSGTNNDYVGAALGSLTNSISIGESGTVYSALYVAAAGVLGTLANTSGGTLSATIAAVNNLGAIGLLSNSGLIEGAEGLTNTGSIGTLANAAQ